MDFIGQKVKHKSFGEGFILSISEKIIKIEFTIGIKKLQYPQVFENLVIAIDADVQKAITDKIKKDKESADEAKKVFLQEKEKEDERKKSALLNKQGKIVGGDLDSMFSADYNVEYLARHPILTYQEVEKQFGIKIAGFGRGINPTQTTIVLISSIKKSGNSFVYHDKWTKDGEYIYSGEGKIGDQKLNKGNLAIKNAELDNKKLHLFVKFSPQEYYYQGVFELVEYTYEDDKDEDGNMRKEYKFRLRKVDE